MDAAVDAILRAEQSSSAGSDRGWLGIAVADSPPYSPTGQPLPPHVTITQVLPGSPAAQAGIRAGDVILGVQGQPVQRAQVGVALIGSVPPGSQARIELFRAGQVVAVNVIRGAGGANVGRIPTQPSVSTPVGYPQSQPQAQPQFPQQTSGAVIINGRKLTQKQVQQMTAQYGFPPPAGRYWYDSASGLYGIEGREAIGMIWPGHDYGPLSPNASNGNTNLVVNGRIINSAEYAYLQQVFGVVYPGRYWLDGKTGNYGVEGNRMPIANVYVIMQQQARRRGGGGGYRWRDGRGSIAGTEGSCTWISVPGDSAGARMYGCD
jgi:membrane-associated protease RseP (regulator of RpoE activity)